MPEISVIIPVYNTAKYLAECLDSVLAQTFTDFEVICIDDGSGDNSAEILKEYAARDKRIKIISQKNSGVVAARNTAIAHAKGKFIYPLDSDDIITQTCLERLYNTITTTNYRVVASEACLFDKKIGILKQPKFTKYEMYGAHECCVISALFYKEDFVRFGGYKLDFNGFGGDDIDYWLNYIDNDMPMFRVPECLFLYRVKDREESVWKNFSKKDFNSRQQHKNALLLKYHPKMKKYVKLYNHFSGPRRNFFVFQIRIKPSKVIIRLFNTLPLLKIQNKTNFYLFGFLPMLKIKLNSKGQKSYNIFGMTVLKTKDDIYKLFNLIPIHRRHDRVRDNYNKQITKLRTKQKIRIGFLVWENSKWCYESLYNKFAKDDKFDVIVMIVEANNPVCDLIKNIHFFSNYNHCIIQNIQDFKKQNIDIVFYEQPWFALNGEFSPKTLSNTALTFYVPYAIQMDADNADIVTACSPFYKNVYMSFMFNKKILSNFKQYDIHNMIAVGHPKLDIYLHKSNYIPKNKYRIIYAPHHSFSNSPLKWATWEWNGEHILELARNNQNNIEWVFKPHPRFQFELAKLLKSDKKAQKVFDDWAGVAKIYDKGNYFDLFQSADLMISDCGSFVLEWLPTEKPYIQLISQNPNASPRSETDEYYSSQYYKCNNLSDIDKYFNLLVNQHKDPRKARRIALSRDIRMGATQRIYKFVKGLTQ